MTTDNLAKKLCKKLGNTIPKRQFFDIFTLINNYLYEEIINDRPIYIDQFGVFTQITPNSRKVWSKGQNKYIISKPTRKLIFRPHSTFIDLIKSKKKNLGKAQK